MAHIHGHNGQKPYRKNIPVYFTAIPWSKGLSPKIEKAIKRKSMILVVTNTEEESPHFYLIGLDKDRHITVIDFLGSLELEPALHKLQAHLYALREASIHKLLALGEGLKSAERMGEYERFDLNFLLEYIPFIMEYIKLMEIELTHAPLSLTSLDGNLGKFHSLTFRGVKNNWFEQTHKLRLLSSTPHPQFHPESFFNQNLILKKSSSVNSFFH